MAKSVHEEGKGTKGDDRSGRFVDVKAIPARSKNGDRKILFPTEPSTIGEEKIRRAVERVAAARKK